jgi:hypothetical protein
MRVRGREGVAERLINAICKGREMMDERTPPATQFLRSPFQPKRLYSQGLSFVWTALLQSLLLLHFLFAFVLTGESENPQLDHRRT